MMSSYYNDNDPYCADWLRSLIAEGLIPPGDVDERNITDVQGSDVAGYTQHHFFSGIGGWPLALQLAGWPSTRPVWTGSCPCQPFSSAGAGQAQADPRHLWPEWFRLIRECRPESIFGEQVAAAIGWGWLDGVSTDLEAEGYSIGSAVLGAHSLGAPHRRQRLYLVADASGGGRGQDRGNGELRAAGAEQPPRDSGESRQTTDEEVEGGRRAIDQATGIGFWDNSEFVLCADGQARRVESGLLPLVDGVPFRLADGRTNEAASRAETIRGIGNAIIPPLAAEFIRAFMEGGE